MNRTIQHAALIASSLLAGGCLAGCTAEPAQESTGASDDAVKAVDSLATMLELGAPLGKARALEVAHFYDGTTCRIASNADSLAPDYYEKGALYMHKTPFGAQALCADIALQAGTDSPTFWSVSGAALQAGLALNLGRFGGVEGVLGRTVYAFERGGVEVGGSWNECDQEVDRVCGKLVPLERGDCEWEQGRACMSNVQAEIHANFLSPKSVNSLATMGDFVMTITGDGPAFMGDDLARIVTFLEYRMNLGKMTSPRPSFRNDDITFGFERGYATVNSRTGVFAGKNTLVNKSASGNSGIVLAR